MVVVSKRPDDWESLQLLSLAPVVKIRSNPSSSTGKPWPGFGAQSCSLHLSPAAHQAGDELSWWDLVLD